ncbi:Membrane-bound lytic murein transglycosylase D precursor [Methylophaga frappieri]|uniref:Membrane-bound lytic murein transglycosylase D n=1 Tax=Methylophaga frappieri (strain ATCC BAA-2434 / DSM 25690 / JAM7) TaxID=754477 RepID=I1YK26_METFJ|nr:LysM peptidoglycan-binding domain-containing protein [Methylophaga frappieri]AFJ03269.1 Membrane-bound lytic murein transglycosylase D precursor [Methylophaga frappieri]
MLNVNSLLRLGVTVLLVLISGCSTTQKQPEMRTENTVNSQPVLAAVQQRPPHWQRNHMVTLEPDEFDLQLLAEENDQPMTDVWQRIRAGYAIDDYRSLHPETQTRLSWFVKHPDYVNRVVERARPYLFYIVDELDKRDMPMEIALLPIIESGYQPFAVSSSGAAGIWQFIPGTGKVFGLEQTWWYDGRRDVIRSTDAALDYLQKLHGYFGDWQLAIAAYNAGEGTVGRAIKRNQELGLDTDFWSLDLPVETTGYIPKLLAVAHLIKRPAQYDIALSPVQNVPFLSVVETGSQLDMAVAADLAGMDKDQLYQLNPGYSRWATAPDGPHQLVLPISKASAFKSALARLPENKRLSWRRHTVRRGDSLGKIASEHQTTVNAIKTANQLSSNLIKTGAELIIPAAGQSAPTVSQPSKQKRSQYTVKPGDSWWHIARKYNVDVGDLVSWNNKSAQDMLHVGQAIIVWQPMQKSHKQTVNYTIRNGDSLWKISRQFNVSVADVKVWNNLSEFSLLQPGQKLTLYIDS